MADDKRKTRKQLAIEMRDLRADINETKAYLKESEAAGELGKAHNARNALYVKEGRMKYLRAQDKARTPKRKMTLLEKALQYING